MPLQLTRWLIAVVLFFAAPILLRAQSGGETNAFRAATELFQATFYSHAEIGFGNFVATYTNSVHRAEAILFQARSRFGSTNYSGAIELLQKQLPAAGDLADSYHFWIAQSLLQKREYQAAADAFGNLIKNFPRSVIRLEASFNQALAYSKLSNWPRAIELLRKPEGDFQIAAREQPKSEFAVRGLLLLGETLFAQKQFAEGEKIVRAIDAKDLTQEFNWRRQYWLCRLQLAGGRANDALESSTNLVTLASGGQRELMADTIFLRSEIFEKLGQWAEALQVYTNKLAEGLPVSFQRRALFKTVELMLKQNQTQEAMKRLEIFIEQNPLDASLDLARLTLGELNLKNFYAATETNTTTNILAQTRTNFLQQALTNFDRVILDFPQSTNRGKAHLDRGWCFWEQEKMADAKTNFLEATNRLPPSEDQAMARFKLADAQFSEGDYGAAVTNYNLILRNFATMESVTNRLFDQALYQILRASIKRDDRAMKEDAFTKILNWYPTSLFSQRSRLLYGEDLTRLGHYAAARKIFTGLIEKFPNTKILPEAQFAVARTYEQENDWSSAVESYDRWVTNFSQHALLPQAEFSRALAYDKAGLETNALMLFTNFVTRFPSNNLAPWAQNWVGDFYFNREEFVMAEGNYLKVSSAGELGFQARLMAGRAAFARPDMNEARKYFTDFVSDTNAPPQLVNEAYFALGDTIFQQALENANATNNFFSDSIGAAIAAFSKITNGAATNALVPLAFGRIGDCKMKWAEIKSDPDFYTNAIVDYETALRLPQTDLATRSMAEVRLGFIAELQAKSEDEILNHYFHVLFEFDRKESDPFWIQKAGVEAARVCESHEQWGKAIEVYRRVLVDVPSLRFALEKKIAIAEAHKTHSEPAKK